MFDRVYQTFPTPLIVEVIREMFSGIACVKSQSTEDNDTEQLEEFAGIEEQALDPREIDQVPKIEESETEAEETPASQSENRTKKPEILEKIDFLNMGPFDQVQEEDDFAKYNEIDQTMHASNEAYTEADRQAKIFSPPNIFASEVDLPGEKATAPAQSAPEPDSTEEDWHSSSSCSSDICETKVNLPEEKATAAAQAAPEPDSTEEDWHSNSSCSSDICETEVDLPGEKTTAPAQAAPEPDSTEEDWHSNSSYSSDTCETEVDLPEEKTTVAAQAAPDPDSTGEDWYSSSSCSSDICETKVNLPEEKATAAAQAAPDPASTEENRHSNSSCPPCVSVSTSTVANCESTLTTDTTVITAGALAKLPIVLAQFQVQLNINAKITLPQAALEIKEILSSTKLTQSLLLLEPDVVSETGNLFLKGFIRKNITYATPGCANESGICGDLRHCTVDIPFACTTTVTYDTLPIPPLSNSAAEFQFFRKQELNDAKFAEKDYLLSADMSEYNQVSIEYFNELPYCELVSSKIVQYDEFLNRTALNKEAPFEEKVFNDIEEKIVLTLTLRLLQKQLVQIPSAPGLVASEVAPITDTNEIIISKTSEPATETWEAPETTEFIEVVGEVVTTDKDVGIADYNKLTQAVTQFIKNQGQREAEPID